MHRRLRALVPVMALGAATLLAACEDRLPVENNNNPGVADVLRTPALTEGFVSTLYQQAHNAVYSTSSILPGVMVMSFESASQLNNFNMGPYSAIPRSAVDNSIGNGAQTQQLRIFDQMQRISRQAVNAILRFDTLMAQAAPNAALQDPRRDARTLAVAFFALGYSLGSTALVYDSAAITTPVTVQENPFGVLPLSGAFEVNEAALQMLDSALFYAGQMGSLNIPEDWYATVSGDLSAEDFTRLIHSHKARFRAGIARSPEEAASIDWQAVVDDATQGITKNFRIQLDNNAGWNHGWLAQANVGPTWSQMSPMILGMADTTGAYLDWINTPFNLRTPFLIRTPDLRFPSGETRAEQQAITGDSRVIPTGSHIYMRNRPTGQDAPQFAFGTSYYDHIRYSAFFLNSGVGPFDDMTVAENDMLAAEGYLRLPTPNIAEAARLIDKTRVDAGLPALSGVITALNQPVPGGSACVPQVPSASTPHTLSCGNIFEAMKWEKRLETQFNGYASWWVDSRRWGDLVEGTPVEFPVPYQEYNSARGLPIYSTAKRAGPNNTYGFP